MHFCFWLSLHDETPRMMHPLPHHWVQASDQHVDAAGDDLENDPYCDHFPANTEYKVVEANILSRSAT